MVDPENQKSLPGQPPAASSAVPLTLGLPARQLNTLTGNLLCASAATQPGVLPVFSASELLNGDDDRGRIAVRLDCDPADLRGNRSGRYEAVRFDLDCDIEDLPEALDVRVPAPLAIFVRGCSPAESAEQIVAAGRIPGLDVDGPMSDSAGPVSDFLSVLAHSDVGFVARVRSEPDVLALLCGTVAALRGADTRRALSEPDPQMLTALSAEAADAVREVLTGIEVPDSTPVLAMFAQIGIGP
ncbi:MAG: hypothetical protein GX542_04235 [Rhodococcus sp.]|nr:hypothetical protein [Rhodococcus sp. (in: high G+C Gram-positive bacteria)]